jgi:hypothetical protein
MKTSVVNIKFQEFDLYIGRKNASRGLGQSVWANPFPINAGCTREQSIERFTQYLLGSPELLARLDELRGKRLGCWCKPLGCHGDILAGLADAGRLPEKEHCPRQLPLL